MKCVILNWILDWSKSLQDIIEAVDKIQKQIVDYETDYGIIKFLNFG